MIAAMVRAFKKVNGIVQVDCLVFDDNGTGDRVVDIVIGGPASADGSIVWRVGGEVDFTFTQAVTDLDTADDIATAAAALLEANTKLPFVVTAPGAATLTFTAVNAGTVANTLGIECIIDCAGVTVDTNIVETTAGLLDPVIGATELAVLTERYQGIVWPYSNSAALQTFLGDRFNATNQVLDGVGIITINGTQSEVEGVVTPLNSPSVVYFCDKDETETSSNKAQYLGPALNEPSYAKSAQFAGIRSLRLTDGASISQFLTSTASLDQFGGPALASLPYFNTVMPDLPVIKSGRGWTDVELESIKDEGGSVIGNNITGTNVLVGEVVTTYKTDTAANVDKTFRFLNYVDTASGAREYFHNNYRKRFAQDRLTTGAVSRGRGQANRVILKQFGERLYGNLAGVDFVLVQDGEDALVFFKNNQVVILDLDDGEAVITMVVPIQTQLRTILATMKVAFSLV